MKACMKLVGFGTSKKFRTTVLHNCTNSKEDYLKVKLARSSDKIIEKLAIEK